MRTRWAAVLFVALASRAQQPASLRFPVGVWRTQDSSINWVYAPKELGYKERGGGAAILRFYPDHSFALIYDTVIQRRGQENASEGDPWTTFFGTWREQDGQLFVSYALAYRDIQPVKDGRAVCDPPVKDKALNFDKGFLMFGDQKLQRAPQLETSVDRLFNPKDALPLNEFCALDSEPTNESR